MNYNPARQGRSSRNGNGFGDILVLVWFALGLISARAAQTPLDDYVRKPDSAFSWKIAKRASAEDFTVTHLQLVSQTWREHEWTHDLQVVRPSQPRHPDLAFLFITGDGNGIKNIPMLKVLAERAGAIAAVVMRVPNQPLYDGRKEDALIAYTFDQFMKTKDPTWPLLFPMTKSATKAMDAVEAFAKKEHGQTVTRFVVGGASKRGWTTWLTAATDQRVVAMAPMVIDMLNMKTQIEWAEKVYGHQSKQIHDYTDLQLDLKMDDPRMVKLRSWVDPYSYRDRYTMPKLILLGTNDPYWTVDSLRHYWSALPGPKLIFQTPNAGHDLRGGEEAIPTLAAFFELIAEGQPLPQMSWNFEPDTQGQVKVSVRVQQPAKSIRLWTADSQDRDFRNDTWTRRDLEIKPGSNHSETVVEPAAQGYRAYLGEVVLTTPSGHEYKLSTEARVTPDNIKLND
jgi:PhoPQ-activated pathogenicity-related protein